MFLLDSLMISGIRWTLETLVTAAEAEMNDDGRVLEQLLEAETRRETGELSEEEFRRTEARLLARLREIRERRSGGSGPLELAAPASVDPDAGRFLAEVSVTGDFHSPSPSAEQVQPSPSPSARQVQPSPKASAARLVTAPAPRQRKRVRPSTRRARRPRT